MESTYFWPLMTIAAIFVGMGKGGLPVVASLAVPSLSLIMSPVTAAGLLLPIYIVSDIFAIRAYRRDYDWQVLKVGFIGMTLGVLVGGLTAHIVLDWVITLLIGLMGLVFSLKQIFQRIDFTQVQKTLNTKTGVVWCTIAGFTSFISHNGGPPWQIFALPLGLSKSVFVGTSVIAFSYCNLIKAIPYLILNQMTLETVKISLYLMVPATIAVFMGVKIITIIPEKVFFKIVTWALLLISLKLIYDGLNFHL